MLILVYIPLHIAHYAAHYIGRSLARGLADRGAAPAPASTRGALGAVSLAVARLPSGAGGIKSKRRSIGKCMLSILQSEPQFRCQVLCSIRSSICGKHSAMNMYCSACLFLSSGTRKGQSLRRSKPPLRRSPWLSCVGNLP